MARLLHLPSQPLHCVQALGYRGAVDDSARVAAELGHRQTATFDPGNNQLILDLVEVRVRIRGRGTKPLAHHGGVRGTCARHET